MGRKCFAVAAAGRGTGVPNKNAKAPCRTRLQDAAGLDVLALLVEVLLDVELVEAAVLDGDDVGAEGRGGGAEKGCVYVMCVLVRVFSTCDHRGGRRGGVQSYQQEQQQRGNAPPPKLKHTTTNKTTTTTTKHSRTA